MKKFLFVFAVLIVALVVWLFLFRESADSPALDQANTTIEDAPASEAESQNLRAEEISITPLEYDIESADSIWLVVNKQRPISLGYFPEDLVDVDVSKREDKSVDELKLRKIAAESAEEMFKDAKVMNVDLLMGSAYRSADLQAFYYNNYVATFGQAEADMFSAKPGTSEHQTGLALDVSADDQVCYLESCFADTLAGQWVADNAHKYGFIIRYPEGKEATTGYQFEPWHLRYVGEDLATELFEKNQTLEEYFNLEG